jgi:hypothetical protein
MYSNPTNICRPNSVQPGWQFHAVFSTSLVDILGSKKRLCLQADFDRVHCDIQWPSLKVRPSHSLYIYIQDYIYIYIYHLYIYIIYVYIILWYIIYPYESFCMFPPELLSFCPELRLEFPGILTTEMSKVVRWGHVVRALERRPSLCLSELAGTGENLHLKIRSLWKKRKILGFFICM